MSGKSLQPQRPDDLTRRESLRDGAVTAAGVSVGIGAAGCQQE